MTKIEDNMETYGHASFAYTMAQYELWMQCLVINGYDLTSALEVIHHREGYDFSDFHNITFVLRMLERAREEAEKVYPKSIEEMVKILMHEKFKDLENLNPIKQYLPYKEEDAKTQQ